VCYRKTGIVVESPKADVFRFRDGLIVEFFEFFDTARALAATRSDG
jgi:ketosteroid isomerase-like protein